MSHRECGPGLISPKGVPAQPVVPDYESPWWYDYGTHEIVRASDGARYNADDVPELVASAREARPVDLGEVDRWVLEQSARER